MRITFTIATLVLAGAALTQVAARDRKPPETVETALAGFTAGPPTSCLPLGRNIASRRVDDRTILFRVSARETWRNDLAPACAGIDKNAAMIAQTPIGRLCKGDIVNFVDLRTGFSAGACPLGTFTPYRRGGR
jgi:hypothetical protein